MSGTDTTRKINKYGGFAIGIVSAVISIALAMLTIGMIAKYNPAKTNNEEFALIIFGIFIPFVLFFGVVAFRGLATLISDSGEVMTIRGWRLLAALLFLCGMVGLVYSHWVALLLPVSMALICLLKDKWVMEKLNSLWWFR